MGELRFFHGNSVDELKAIRGSGPPTADTIPEYVGHIYVDEDSGDAYIAKGPSSADWDLLDAGTGGTPGEARTVKLSKAFTFNNFSATELTIDSIPENHTVYNVLVFVDTEFSVGCALSVGDDSANARLVSSTDCDLTSVSVYDIEPYVRYSSSDTLKIYFSGSPTQGSGSVVIYYEA